MKRILHILAQRPEKTGSGTYLQALIDQGRQAGYDQAVVAGIPSSENHAYFHDSIAFYPVLFETADLPFPVAGMTDIMPYKSTMYRNLDEAMYSQWRQAFAAVLAKAVEEFRPDAIIAHHLWLLSSLAKEMFPHIEMTVICHGTDLRQMRLAPQFTERVALGCRCIDHIAALHEEQKRNIIETYDIPADKITVVGAGYNPDIFYRPQQLPPIGTIPLIYAGKLNFAKGVPSLIRAYNKLAPEGANLKLAFAGTGTGSQCDNIVNMAHDSRLPIDLKGIVPQQELAQLFRQSRLFVFPSFYEGLPLVLMEALACGLRIVTTDLPGVRDFFGPLINGRGLVEYVALPPLKTIDEPVEEALPDFETRFAAALKKQVAAIQSGDDGWDDAIEKQIRTMTWQAVFHKIEKLFTR